MELDLDFTKCIPGIRLLQKPDSYDSMNWVHRTLIWPRSLTDWVALWKQLREPIFPGEQRNAPVHCCDCNNCCSGNNTIPHPWFHRAEAAAQLEEAFYRNQGLRYQMRRIFMAWSAKKMARRIMGEKDVGTLDIIPDFAKVSVYDWATRSLYQFHVSTIHRNIAAALKYTSMAISSPKVPKNPYTNLPWSLGQLLALYDQIHARLWQHGRQFMDPAVQAFYGSHFSIDVFRKSYGYSLDAECSRQFFHDPTSEYWDVLYGETLTELFRLIPFQNSAMIRTLVLDQSLPKQRQTIWNDILWAFWCYENLERIVLPNICSIDDLLDSAREVVQWTLRLVERRKIARKKIVAPS